MQAAPTQHTLPDGQVITLAGAEAEACGEGLLQPLLLDPDFRGASVFESAVISALAHQEPALRKVRFFGNVLEPRSVLNSFELNSSEGFNSVCGGCQLTINWSGLSFLYFESQASVSEGRNRFDCAGE